MPWPKGTAPGERVLIELKALLSEAGVAALGERERVTPLTRARVLSATELRSAIPHIDPETGKRCRWQQFDVLLDLVGDDKTAPGAMSVAEGKLFDLFESENFAPRALHGLFTARLRRETNQFNEGDLKNPFMVTCDTFTFAQD